MPVQFKLRRVTRILLIAFCVLVIGVVFVGLDNIIGNILAYLAIISLVTVFTSRWRNIYWFLLLLILAFIGMIFLSFLYVELFSRIAIIIGGIDATESTAWAVFSVIISGVIRFIGPACIIVGFFGAITVSIVKLVNQINQKKVIDST